MQRVNLTDATNENQEIEYSFNPAAPLAAGNFGSVFEGKNTTTDDIVAVKRIHITEVEVKKAFEKENLIMSKLLGGTNIVQIQASKAEYHHTIRDTQYAYIAMTFGTQGDLKKFIGNVINGNLKFLSMEKEMQLPIMWGMANGLAYMHSLNIIHRDLKPQNIMIMLNKQGIPVPLIGDFGHSEIDTQDEHLTMLVGNIQYAAPEQLSAFHSRTLEKRKAKPYSKAGDVYSSAVIFWELLELGKEAYTLSITTKPPLSTNEFVEAVVGNEHRKPFREPIPAGTNPRLATLIEKAWAPERTNRPTADEMSKELYKILHPKTREEKFEETFKKAETSVVANSDVTIFKRRQAQLVKTSTQQTSADVIYRRQVQIKK